MVIILGFYIFTLLYSIILHEIAHGYAALKLGDHTAKNEGRLTLDPVPHIDPLGSIILPVAMAMTAGFAFGWAKPVPYNPYALRFPKWGPFIVAIAGPITNFVLAIIFMVCGALLPASAKTETINALLGRQWENLALVVSGDIANIFFLICVMAIFWNVLLGLFNLLPIPPLDGSKLIATFVAVPDHIWRFLEQWGFFIIIGLFVFTPVGGYFSGFLAQVLSIIYGMMI